jgi:molecular chaperone DnaK
MYSQAGAQPGPDAGFNAGGADQNASQNPGKENIQDADFEEVK